MKTITKAKFKQTEFGTIPVDWELKKWGDLITLEYGKGLKGYQVSSGKFPVFGTNGQIGWCNEFVCPSEGVIIGRKGAYRGIHYSPTPFFAIDTAFFLKPISELDLRWAYYELLTHDINNMDSGSAIPSTSKPDFYGLVVKYPPIQEQKAIAKVLSDFDSKIDLNQQMNRTLEVMTKSIFEYWFIDFEFPNEKGNPYKSSGGEMVYNEESKKEIPKGWEVRTLAEVTEAIFSGGTPDTRNHEFWNGTIPWLSSGETSNHFIVQTEKTITEKGVENSSTRMAKFGDIVIAAAGQGSTRGQTSLCLLDTYINQSMVALRARIRAMTNTYLFFNLSMRYRELRGISDSNSIRGSLTTRIFKDLKIVAPPFINLKVFDQICISHVRRISSNLIENQKLSQLRDILLPKLMSGKIRVPIEVRQK